MVILDTTVVNIALPSAQRALHFANSERQWIVTAYALAFGSLLLLGGRISDLLGRKWTFVAGLAGFASASAVGGAAGSFAMLVVARAFQGAFGVFARARSPVPDDDASRTPASATRRSGSGARSPAAAARSGCSSAAS